MTARELAEAIEVVRDRFYWAALQSQPKNTSQVYFLSIDGQLTYEPFLHDFGPLDLSAVCRYCKLLRARLKDPALAEKRIVHYTSQDPRMRANAAFLICAYQVIVLRKTAEEAFQPFFGIYPPFLPFRDATAGGCTFQCTISDCLKGLEKSIELGWFDWKTFNVDQFDFFKAVEHGDMSWIIPNKFLAFVGPLPTPVDEEGFPAFTPEDYVPIFRDAGIELVIRLNKKQYDGCRFVNYGIKHVDLYFRDGSCPSPEIIQKFLHIVENEPNAVAIHCKAGLGRTGSLIALYAMKHYRFPARAFIGWNRICRPGSILGPQQQYLCDMQQEMFQAGAAINDIWQIGSDAALAERVGRMSLRDRQQAELFEDVGQGERLQAAKRSANSSPKCSAGGSSNSGQVDLQASPGAAMSYDSAGLGSPARHGPIQQSGQRTKVDKIKRSLKGMFSR